jgi:hypothetical protein
MNVVQRLDGLELHEHCILDQHIDSELANDDTVLPGNDSALLRNDEPRLAKLMRERILINLLEKSGSERVGHRERASDNVLGKTVHYSLSRVGEDVATLAPHRPGRADFRHPVPHARVSPTVA